MEHHVGMMTDRYELTMLSSFIRDGMEQTPAVFEVFTRRLPPGRQYAVMAGTGRLAQLLTEFRFTATDIAYLLDQGVISGQAASWLADFSFTGDIDAYAEGDVFFPGSPIVRVTAPLGQGLLLETLLLSVLNHDCAVAAAASRMVTAAQGRALLEMGSRRVHEHAAPAGARAAHIAGFSATSNLAAGLAYDVPTVGTAAHAFTLAHRDERAAFAAQVAQYGPGTTLLVDTYDTAAGIRTAVEVAGPRLGAIRLDSGDLLEWVPKARGLLDGLGAHRTKIVVTGDLDEHSIHALVAAGAPVDIFGVGTAVATGSGYPSAGLVYKLVAIDDGQGQMRPVAKASQGKASVGGVKVPFRSYDAQQQITGEHYTRPGALVAGTALQVPLVRAGRAMTDPARALHAARSLHANTLAQLPERARELTSSDAVFQAQEA